MAVIEGRKLAKEYDGRRVLTEVSVAVTSGDAFALIGPTGSGKTTLIRLLDLLEVPTSGGVFFDGVDVTSSPGRRLETRRRMAYVQQKPVMFAASVYDNIACGLKWRHERSETIKHRVEGALELVGMGDYRKRDARTLSGGETQRVAIARALVTGPEILFLDEPTANLDPISTLKVEQVIFSIIRERKVAVVMATHDMAQGQRLASRMGVLLDGAMRQMGSPGDISSSPASREVAEFVGVENMLSGKVIDRNENLLTVDVFGHHLQAVSEQTLEGEVYVLVRPENITFSLSRELTSARNVLAGVITRITPAGPLMRIEVDCGFPLLGVVTTSSTYELELEVGKSISLSFKATAAHVIKRWS
jgi:tungstate transport system ATP-binding protein